MANDVSSTVEGGLCVSCGACTAACPQGAIAPVPRGGMFVPQVNAGKCVSCGRCIAVCPGATTDCGKYFGIPEFLGTDAPDAYAAAAVDAALRHASTSGGVATALICELLAKGLYRQAYVLDFDVFHGRQAELAAVSSRDGILRAAKSKYIPASVGRVVEAVKENRIDGSVVVCTPCQLLAIRKAMDAYGRTGDGVLFIGLFCDRMFNYSVYDEYMRRYGPFTSFNFRDKDAGGWPGSTTLRTESGALAVDRSVRMSLKKSCRVARCGYCFDKLNQAADISLGDCYVPGYEAREGVSSVLVRTRRGRDAFAAARSALSARPASYTAVKASQGLAARSKNLEKAMKETKLYSNVPAAPAGTPGRGRAFRVLIDVEGFRNRGDQLMLDAAYRQVRARTPGAVVAVPLKAYLENPSWCVQRRIVPLMKFERKAGRRLRQRLNRFLAGRVMHRSGFVLPDEIDLVLFAAGFNYGDQLADLYTPANIADEVRYFASFTKPGRKFVLLPQALGPFRTPQAKDKMTRLYPHVDLVYAREDASAANLRELFPDVKNVRTAPDFTCLCEPLDEPIRLKAKSYVALIPNMRMVDRTEERVSRGYMTFLVELVRALTERGETVILLNHEGKDDEALCHEINAHFDNSLTILSGLSGIDCKAVVARAKLVVSSRFHGVVSGLVEGVPTLCTSWSHKYGELLKEHGRPGNALDVLDVETSVAKVCDALERPESYTSAPGCADRVRERVQDMWEEIFAEVPQWAADCAEPKYRLF